MFRLSALYLIPLLLAPRLLWGETDAIRARSYIRYAMDLEKRGGYKSAAYVLEQAMEHLQDADLQTKKMLSEYISNLKEEAKKPRPQETMPQPSRNYYLSFGGARLGFGGSSGTSFGLNGRFGMLTNTGSDMSVNLGLNTPGATSIGFLAQLRKPFGSESPGFRKTWNYGVQLAYTGSQFTGGYVIGLSIPLRGIKGMSMDLMADQTLLGTTALNLSFGMTMYFGSSWANSSPSSQPSGGGSTKSTIQKRKF